MQKHMPKKKMLLKDIEPDIQLEEKIAKIDAPKRYTGMDVSP
jgi:putative transposon-encoded protein